MSKCLRLQGKNSTVMTYAGKKMWTIVSYTSENETGKLYKKKGKKLESLTFSVFFFFCFRLYQKKDKNHARGNNRYLSILSYG